jgi:hypothetical protein
LSSRPTTLLFATALAAMGTFVACGDDGGGSPPIDPDALVPVACETNAECGLANACKKGVCVNLHGQCEPGICGGDCAACGEGTVCLEGLCTDSQDTEICPTLGIPELAVASATYDARKTKTIRHIRAVSNGSAPWEEIEITLKEGAGFSYTGTGAYDLGDQDYATCSTCVVAQRNCHEVGCVRQFFARSGTLVIYEDGGPNGTLAATIYGAILDEVYLDSKTESAIVMPTGSPWCLPEVSLKAKMTDVTQESDCDHEGTGNTISKRVGNFGLTNCLGLTRDLMDGCGDTRAFWFLAVAAW